MAVCQNLVPLVNIKIAGKWMFIPLKMVLIGIDPYPYIYMYITYKSAQHALPFQAQSQHQERFDFLQVPPLCWRNRGLWRGAPGSKQVVSL